MTKRELVKATIAHKQTEAVPFCFGLAKDAQEAYLDRLYNRYATTAIKKLVDKQILDKAEGFRLATGSHVYQIRCPWWSWFNVPSSYKTNFDAPSFMPKTIGTGSYTDFLEKAKIIKELTGSYILVMIYGSHFEKAYFSRGIENFLADLAGNKEFSRDLLELIIRKNLVMLENIVSVPEIDGILLGSDWGSQQNLLMSPTTWRELIAPGEKEEYNLIKSEGKDVWIHSCGNIESILPDLITMGVDVLNPLQPECMDIYHIKQTYGDKLSFWGGISTQQTLPFGTPADVRQETEKVIDYLSRGGGYIASPAQGIQADVPYDNIIAFIETARAKAGL